MGTTIDEMKKMPKPRLSNDEQIESVMIEMLELSKQWVQQEIEFRNVLYEKLRGFIDSKTTLVDLVNISEIYKNVNLELKLNKIASLPSMLPAKKGIDLG